MNDQNENAGSTFDIFGDGAPDLGSAEMPDPFAASGNTTAPAGTTPLNSPAADTMPLSAPAQTIPAPTSAQNTPVSDPQPVITDSAPQEDAEPVNLLAAAVKQAEDKQAAVTAESLFAKLPVFVYAAASEDVTDTSITFEQLRVEKSTDFPELDDVRRVSWSVEYCGITKLITAPAKTVIGKLKKEIENSKEFLDSLKRAKDKNPVCKIKPKITAQSKGIAGYKGVFPSMEEADASDKHIRILPARDGYVYEIRCTEAGKFIARVENVRELSVVSAGFIPALPPVPFPLFSQVIAFFRSFMRDGYEAEALVHVYWDKTEQRYKIVPPMQSVSKASISVATQPDESLDAERYIHVADVHSHNSMPAFFSKTDNDDELATRVYLVVGCLDQQAPEISARISVGGRFVSIDAKQVIDIPAGAITPPSCRKYFNPAFVGQRFKISGGAWFPPEWSEAVHVTETPRHEERPFDIPVPEHRLRRFFRFLRSGESV